MADQPTFTMGVPQNVFTLPTPTDITLTPFWTTILQKDNFLLQKSSSPGNHLFRNLMSTIANVFDTKLPPFRILFQREVNTMCLQIAVAETESSIRLAWSWIEKNMIPELEIINHPHDKENWVLEKINMIVATIECGTDELSSDEKVRNASRSFRQIFEIPPSERFVNYYSCAYKSRQGWLYISENYLGFYSFLLGIETKVLIELKDIQEIKKERSKGIFGDSLRLITKSQEECYLTNMFRRDEVYELLLQLAGQAMQRWLKSSAGSSTPGSPVSSLVSSSSTRLDSQVDDQQYLTDDNNKRQHPLRSPLKKDLEARKRNDLFCARFRLPVNQSVLYALEATYYKEPSADRDPQFISQVPSTLIQVVGRVYLSQTFLTFESEERLPAPQQHLPLCKVVLPLYTIKRVERISKGAYTSGVAITTWHKMEHDFLLHAEKHICEQLCEALKSHLLKQTPFFKKLKSFLTSCESEQLFHIDSLIDTKIHIGGLGMEFGYPVNPKSSKEKSKVKLWKIYFQENGRNLTMIQLSTFGKLVRVGLPNLLRGEIWEVSSGAMYLRFANQGVYQEILAKYKDQKSTSTEEIEKDLNRSLPEYPGYQTSEGINRLRRVLTAYAWKNPELGYCQAMNIVVSALLIYTTEEQAFWILHVLVDRFCPGYYSTNMYGALLDQIVFEKLVQRTMPLLWEHFQKTNVELSVACLPWFLSLYINSMPLEYAVRVLDILFMEGPRIIFQIGLAILKANGDDLLKTTDDGGFLNVFKTFFQTIGDKEEVKYASMKHIKTTKFNEIMFSAYREFSLVTNEMVMELRNQNQLKVGASIESFTKRTAIRNLKDMASFSKDDIAILYDKYFTTLYYARKDSDNTSISKMNRAAFQSMLQSMTPWAKPSTSFPSEGHDSSHNADANAANNVCNSFIDRLFKQFLGNDSPDDLLDFQHMVKGMSDILHGDIMSHLDWYFDLYDTDKDGLLGSEDIVTMSKEMYWLISHLKDTDMAWDAVTNLIVNSHEQSDIARGGQPDENTLSHRLADLTMTTTPKRVEAEAVAGNGRMLWSFRDRTRQLENSMLADTVDLSLPSFRMVALTNESLEMFFDHEFANSFQLVKSTSEVPKSLGREVFENLFADGQKLATAVQNSNTSMSRSPFLSDTSSHKEKPTTPKSSEDSSSHVRQSEEMDADNALMDDWVHFDIWREKKTAQ